MNSEYILSFQIQKNMKTTQEENKHLHCWLIPADDYPEKERKATLVFEEKDVIVFTELLKT